MYAVAELATLKQPLINLRGSVIFPKDFTRNLEDPSQAKPSQAAIWGGASKGVIFTLLKARAGQPISTVIDINPAKQGKYLPSTGLLVKSPTEALAMLAKGSIIYVMNSNYLEEIKKMSNNTFNYIKVDHD
jgi:hypothetical protein